MAIKNIIIHPNDVQNIYEDFTKELIPFLIRSDLLPMIL